MENIDSVLLTAPANKELGGFVESEKEESGTEESKCHGADNDHLISPAHVARHRAACHAGTDGIAGGQTHVASILRGGSVGDGGCHDNSDRLPHSKEENQVSSVLWEKFERDCGVDGDVAAEADAGQKVDAADRAVVEFTCSLKV